MTSDLFFRKLSLPRSKSYLGSGERSPADGKSALFSFIAVGTTPSADNGEGVKTDDPVVEDDADGDDDSCTAGNNIASKSVDAE